MAVHAAVAKMYAFSENHEYITSGSEGATPLHEQAFQESWKEVLLQSGFFAWTAPVRQALQQSQNKTNLGPDRGQ